MFLLTNSWFGRSGSNNSRRAEIKEKFTGEVGKIGKRKKKTVGFRLLMKIFFPKDSTYSLL